MLLTTLILPKKKNENCGKKGENNAEKNVKKNEKMTPPKVFLVGYLTAKKKKMTTVNKKR